MATLFDILAEANLSHLGELFANETLETCASRLVADGRPAYLKHIKELGVEKLSDRQKLATVISKAAKAADGGLPPPPLPKNASLSSMTMAKEFTVSGDVHSSQFATNVSPLKPLGDSPLLPGEADGVRRPDARIRLIALYGSGYEASAFDEWQRAAPKWLELRTLELPGHGARAAEGFWSLGTPCAADGALSNAELSAKLIAERDAFIKARADELLPLITCGAADDAPYALYGFSSGAMFGYLLVLELARRRAPLPFRLIVCGRAAPHIIWAPATVRTLRCADEAAMEEWLWQALAVAKEAPGEDGAGADLQTPAVARKHALWRAPLLTAALCSGAFDPEVATGPFVAAGGTRGGGDERDIKHASGAPKLPVPLLVLASTTDKVWSFALTERWTDVAGGDDRYKFVELGKLSHFKLMCSAEAIQQTTVELASAALAGANQVKWS